MNYRKCLACDFKGIMGTWLTSFKGALIALLLLLLWIVPGLIFIAWGSGKFKCPNCGAIGKSVAIEPPAWMTAAAREREDRERKKWGY